MYTKINTDTSFQCILNAATSPATKVNEETLTYLNQGQSYELRIKKLGDHTAFHGKLFKEVYTKMNTETSFQCILNAATSPATKVNEETLTYLNQGQSYELGIKKLGDHTAFHGKLFKVSVYQDEY